MNNKLDYNSDEVMQILNNETYTDEQKKNFFEKYKSDLKAARKKQLIEEVNDLAKRIPIITEEIYVNFLKKYEDDNLSKPFSMIEKEIKEFEVEMTEKYNAYLEEKNKVETPEVKEEQTPVIEEQPEEESVPEEEPVIQPTQPIATISENNDSNSSVLNEEPEILSKPLVDIDAKDVMPGSDSEKGSASAIIISIIAIIIGAVVMYTIIKMN